MTDRIELSEAIRSILGEENGEKENCHMESPEVSSILSSSMLHTTTWSPRHAPGKGSKFGNAKQKRPSGAELDFKSPPKKRRHINEVIILRNPRRKSKSSPASTGRDLKQAISGGVADSKSKMPTLLEDLEQSATVKTSQSSESSQGLGFGIKQEQKSDTDGQNVTREKFGSASKQQKHPAKRKAGDDSLTNITWLRKMAAPDLDPQNLQPSKKSDSRHDRPPYSYSTLIQFALSTASSGRMTLREIYQWIEVHFPYFRTAKLGWRNSIRHNLSLHKIFVREPPVSHGQPAFWTLQPGTVVRLPEKTMFVARNKSGHRSSAATNARHQAHRTKSSQSKGSTYAHSTEKDDKKRKEPYILPRVTQPLALVPVPIFVSTEAGTRLVTSPATGEPILSPIPINLLPEAQLQSMFPSCQERTGQKKMVKIAPKPSVTHETSMNSSVTQQQTNFPNATVSSLSMLRDSGIGTDGEGTFCESRTASSSQQDVFGASSPEQKHLPIKKRGSPWNGVKSSTPNHKMKEKDHMNDMPDISIFDELPSFDLTPQKTPNVRSKRKLTTPSRAVTYPDWLSPIQGLTPFKLSDDFTNLREDLNVTPPRTGLTPKNRHGSISSTAAANVLSTPKSHRSPALGSLGDLGLSGFTPERQGSVHNQSFGKMFGGDLSFDMDTEGLWSLMSPPR